jgi:hypothetical protein
MTRASSQSVNGGDLFKDSRFIDSLFTNNLLEDGAWMYPFKGGHSEVEAQTGLS